MILDISPTTRGEKVSDPKIISLLYKWLRRSATFSKRHRSIHMKSIFAALAITSVAVAAHAEWSTPVKLREVPGFGISGPRLGTSAAGEAVALWADTPQPGVEQEIVASFLTPGSDWGSPGPV